MSSFSIYRLHLTIPYTVFAFFFKDTATTEIYTLSLHDALPISRRHSRRRETAASPRPRPRRSRDRKSTRLNSSHVENSYAVFCLKNKTTRCGEVLRSRAFRRGGADRYRLHAD